MKTSKRIALTIKTKEPMGIGDKLCYAKGTDVLTTKGWKPVEQITIEDICYTLNSKDIIELHNPTQIYTYATGGEMYELLSQQVDLRVTVNHNLYVQLRGRKNFELVQASEAIGKRVRHKKDGTWRGQTPEFFELPLLESLKEGKGYKQAQKASCRHTPIPMMAWLEFLGIFLANGSATICVRKDRNNSKEYIVSLASEKGQKHSISGDQYSWIKSVIESCGFSYHESPKYLRITSKQLTIYLKRFGHALNKYIPQEIFTYGKDAVAQLLKGLLGCDGAKTNSGSILYTTVSKQLAEDVQRLCLHNGWSANIKERPPAEDHDTWHLRYNVQIVRSKNQPQVNHGHVKTQKGQSEKLFISEEPVYGITIPNHILYVRRNGKPVWSGNSGKFGNKGVVAKIIPDDQMIQDEQGRPIDVILTSAGVVSRINPGQVLEAVAGKVAYKTGKPILIENFSGKDNIKWAKDLLKQNGLKDKETVFDPMTNKKIPGVLVGRSHLLKLFKSTDTNYAARNIAEYDVNQQPTRGGVEGSKSLGKMEFDALVAHNARNFLQESSTLKSQKNDEYWKALQLGYPTPPPKSSFAYDKFLNMLHGSGVRVDRQGQYMSLAPLTDGDIKDLSSGEIKEPKIVRAKDLAPEPGGLFDPAITGGLQGTKWSHIELAEPIVSPVFKEPARRLLGMTTAAFDTALSEHGGAHIKKELAKINLDTREKELLEEMKGKHADKLDGHVKQIKYIRALKKFGLTPDNAYVISRVPVVPPTIRPVLPGKGGQDVMYGDINPLYRDLLYVNNQFKEVKGVKELEDEKKKLRPVLQQAVGAVFGTEDPITSKSKARGHKGFLTYISGVTSPKTGYFQSKVVSKTQDVSGRGTVVPDNTLGMDEVGVPEDMLWGMYEKFVIRKLVLKGYPALEAQKLVEERSFAAREELMREVKERPVILNRAPTLHRYNMVGAFAVPVLGKTLRANPFMEKAMSMDYDGDTLMLHAPVGPKSVEEVKGMTLSNLLFSDKSKSDLLVFPQHESIMGVAHASQAKDIGGKVHKFKSKAEAMKAYHDGKITLGTAVEIEG